MSNLEALIFDVDGTLADTERDGHRIAFNQAFAKAGLDWDWSVELYGELLQVTGGKERIRFYLQKHNTTFPTPTDLDGFIKELHFSKTEIYTKMMAAGQIPARPGVIRILREARSQGVRLAIATTTTPENVIALLEHSVDKDAISWFEVIGAGDIVPAKKPASDIYDFVLREMNLEPMQCMAFEDSHNGIVSSMGADLNTIVTVNDYTRDHDFSGAAIVLDHYGEPDMPFEVIRGDAGGATYLTMNLIRDIHQRN